MSVKTPRAKSVKKSDQQTAKPKKPEASKKVAKKEEPKTPLIERVRQYLREVSYELRKVVWPSRKETIGTTSVVLILVILSGAYLGLIDAILSRVIRFVIG